MPSTELALLQPVLPKANTGVAKGEGEIDKLLPSGLAEAIFQQDPLKTRELLYAHGHFGESVTVEQFVDLMTPYREARLKRDSKLRWTKALEWRTSQLSSHSITKDEYLRLTAKDWLEICKKEREKRKEASPGAVWEPSYLPKAAAPAHRHSYWLTAFARVCFAHLLFTLTPKALYGDAKNVKEKATAFLNGHIEMLAYLDSCVGDGDDSSVDILRFTDGYKSPGDSPYAEDRHLMSLSVRYVVNARRPMPDEILAEIGCHPRPLLHLAQEVCDLVHEGDGHALVTWLVAGTNIEEDPEAAHHAGISEIRAPFFRQKKFRDVQDVLDHSVWSAVLLTLHELTLVRTDGDCEDRHKDAAYLWQLAFVDLADFCDQAQRWDDEFVMGVDTKAGISPLEAFFPWPGRAFHEGDLPSLMSALCDIPLWGEQNVPEYHLGKLLNKSMPFACMRRKLTETVQSSVYEKLAFWRVFSKMMQCMLLGTYPGIRERPNGEKMLAIVRLCANRRELVKQLAIDEDRSCRVIFTAVREAICDLGRLNPAYATACDRVIYWHGFTRDTAFMSTLVRQSNLLNSEDVFAEARVRLEAFQSEINGFVYRYRDKCLSEYMFKAVSKQLEDNTFCDMEDARRDIELFRRLIAQLEDRALSISDFRPLWRQALESDHRERLLRECDPENNPGATASLLRELIEINEDVIERCNVRVPRQLKQDILNAIFIVPEHLRFTEPCFSLLCESKHGGMRRAVVHSLVRLVTLYKENGTPKESEELLSDFSPYELKVVTWFLHCCRLFDRVHLIRLNPNTEQRIERAMLTKRIAVYPGAQQLVENDFAVYYTICCEMVITKKDGIYGHDDVRYCLDTGVPVCKRVTKEGKTQPKHHEPLEYLLAAVTDEEVKTRAKARKIHFLRIKCPQPVLRIPLRGYRLVIGSRRGTKKQYMHCPECAAFHRVRASGYLRRGGYACQTCLAKDRSKERIYKCAYCKCAIKPRYNDAKELWEAPPVVRVLRFHGDPADSDFDVAVDPLGMWQELHFCKKHYNSAVAISHQRSADRARGRPSRYLDKHTLFQRIGRAERRNAERQLNIRFAPRGIPKRK